MPNIQPFEGLRYNLAQVGNLSDVIAPPYDVIGPEQQDELYAKSEYNSVRLILDKQLPTDDEQNNRYTRTARTLKDWKESGVLVKDSNPSIYVYHQIYTVNGKEYCRKGFMAGCEAVAFGEGMVFPHEITMSGPKLDRLMLTTACKTNFSQIFGLYPDENNEVQNVLEEAIVGKTPLEAVDHLGVVSRMWIVDDSEVLSKVVKLMGPKPIFIADGHHRYETACNYRKQLAQQGVLTSNHPANHVLMLCIAIEDPGLIVLPTHRLFPNVRQMDQAEVIARVGECFRVTTVGNGVNSAKAAWALIEQLNDQGTMALYTGKDGVWSLLSITDKGRENGKVCEEELPFSVRLKAQELIEERNRQIRRSELVRASFRRRYNGTWETDLALIDDSGLEMLRLTLTVPTEDRAKDLARRYDAAPEKFYSRLINFLFNEE